MERQSVQKAQKTPAPGNHVQTRSARSSVAENRLLELQRAIGNQAVQRLIDSPYIQAKLQVSTPGDPFEQEADRVAETVMRMPEPSAAKGDAPQIQANPQTPRITPLVQREAEQPIEDEKEETIATEPIVQRAVPLAVREDDEEEKVAAKLDTDATPLEEEQEKTVATKLATDAPLQRQASEDEEKEEETLQAAPPIQRQMDEEDEDTVQTKPLYGSMSQTPRISAASTTTSSSFSIQRLCAECKDQHSQTKRVDRKSKNNQGSHVQRKDGAAATPQLTPPVAANIRALHCGGSPLPSATRAFFEPRFGVDFGQVRVHTGAMAEETAKSISARAFTVGREITFGEGQFAPQSQVGRRLMAHELTHVVQQSGANVVSDGQRTQNRGPSVHKRTMEADPIHHVAPTVQRATREELLTAYNEALSKSDWNDVAVRLNGFNDADIKSLVGKYNKATLIAVKEAALTVMPGWNTRVVRPVNARISALMGPSKVLETSAKEIKDYLLHSPFLKSYVSSKFTGGNPLEGHIHVDDDAAFRTALIAAFISKGKTREEAEAIEPQKQAFRHENDIHVRKDGGTIATLIHESIHLLSSPEYARRLSSNANEGATEYFTHIVCKDQGLARNGAYAKEVTSTKLLVGASNQEIVADAYFGGNLAVLLTAIDTAKGAGTLRRWSVFIDAGSYGRADALLK